ncbi:PREDICTED: GTP cyclohydrolase 1 feedback regulatory protein isoform X1 [Crocodylus porosus]|uniref:GTP cyclohydrolase 1 feedback regulatory protein isoform X1 n=1 Tax=Crocodylus porosus TaxID=8502 RepID=UPI000939D9D3|nr:PREDICTED: GTP cyclohydrolase 1 feedback regulatory protein isoform X1 [Crocodylus porosus]
MPHCKDSLLRPWYSTSQLDDSCVFTLLEEVGPTMVGDEHSDLALMNYLGATKRNMLGNHFWEYYVNDAPRIVLDKLENYGYRVVSMTGVGQTLVWCLHKEDNKVPSGQDINVDPVKLQPRSELPQ